jgi:hypothetical protein
MRASPDSTLFEDLIVRMPQANAISTYTKCRELSQSIFLQASTEAKAA